MKIINNKYITNTQELLNYRVIDGISFLNRDDQKFIVDAANHDIDKIKEWFNIIGIKRDDISIMADNYIVYTVNGKTLMISDLSSGERLLLYTLACREVNKQGIILKSLFERLGSRLTKVAEEVLKDYNNIIVIWYNTRPLSLKQFEVKEI
ncbi:MAG: hypothetical protein NC548_50955 [Lachnospiraceae bacterium]|nr:hypothetical protein [Lachnospiraceae bacterium]